MAPIRAARKVRDVGQLVAVSRRGGHLTFEVATARWTFTPPGEPERVVYGKAVRDFYREQAHRLSLASASEEKKVYAIAPGGAE